MKLYKAFDKDWKCRDFQFELGKTYHHEGEVKLCSSGFHACENPLDVLSYYPPTGKIAEVEMEGVSDETSDDSKRVGEFITLTASLSVKTLVDLAVAYITGKCNKSKSEHATGDQSASSATGDQSASSATGDNAVAAAFGLESTAKAGKTGILVVSWWDGERKRLTVGYVGENGIKPDTAYRCDRTGNLVED